MSLTAFIHSFIPSTSIQSHPPKHRNSLLTGFPLSRKAKHLRLVFKAPGGLIHNPSSSSLPCPSGSQNHFLSLRHTTHIQFCLPLFLVFLWPKIAFSILFIWLLYPLRFSSNTTSFRNKSLIRDINFLNLKILEIWDFSFKGSSHSQFCFGTASDILRQPKSRSLETPGQRKGSHGRKAGRGTEGLGRVK